MFGGDRELGADAIELGGAVLDDARGPAGGAHAFGGGLVGDRDDHRVAGAVEVRAGRPCAEFVRDRVRPGGREPRRLRGSGRAEPDQDSDDHGTRTTCKLLTTRHRYSFLAHAYQWSGNRTGNRPTGAES